MTQQFRDEFIKDISLPKPGVFITDENTTLPLLELQHNIKYLMNLLSGASTNPVNFLSYIYGNLLDYDNVGNKIFFNGGSFDCFEKKHSWVAINDGSIKNDTDIQLTGASNLLVYKGGKSYTDGNGDHGIYLQREFFIPQQLRGSEVVFAVKGTGVYLEDSLSDVEFDLVVPFCNSSTTVNISGVGLPLCTAETSGTSAIPGISCTPDLSSGCYGRYEDIGIEILGAEDTVQEVSVLGPWPSFNLHCDPSWGPMYRTAFVKFRVGYNTSSVKIRIRRTRDEGALAISHMFLGGLPHPTTSFEMTKMDINSLFDFTNVVTKLNSTNIMGHSVSSQNKLQDVLTIKHFNYLDDYTVTIDDFDDDITYGPTTQTFAITSDGPNLVPIHRYASFNGTDTKYTHFNIKADGPNPGLAEMDITYSVDTSGSGDVLIDVWVKVIEEGETFSNNDSVYTKYSYTLPIDSTNNANTLQTFRIYENFYSDITSDAKDAIVSFVVSRKGADGSDTYAGNFNVYKISLKLADPIDDITQPATYSDLFVGENSSC